MSTRLISVTDLRDNGPGEKANPKPKEIPNSTPARILGKQQTTTNQKKKIIMGRKKITTITKQVSSKEVGEWAKSGSFWWKYFCFFCCHTEVAFSSSLSFCGQSVKAIKRNIPAALLGKKRPKTKLSREEAASKKSGLASCSSHLPCHHYPHTNVIVGSEMFFFFVTFCSTYVEMFLLFLNDAPCSCPSWLLLSKKLNV